MSKTGEDCYFFIHGSCRNGDNCLFRHSKESLLTQDICKEWIAGKCSCLLCPKRHPQVSTTPLCKFENSPTGCLNRNCTYRHLKSRESTKLPVALAEALLKKSVSIQHTNGDNKTRQVPLRKYVTAPIEAPEKILEIKLTPEQSTSYMEPELTTQTTQNKLSSILKLKPISVEKPAPIPIVSLRSGAQIEAPSYNTNPSTAIMCNLKVLTSHADSHTSHTSATSHPKPARNTVCASNPKSPPSPITFEERPRKLSPITFSSSSKISTSLAAVHTSPNLGIKRTRLSFKKETLQTESPKEDSKPSMKRLRIRRDSSLPEIETPDQYEDQEMLSPLLSPLDSTAYFGNSISCSLSESVNGSQSDDIRIEDQIEDLIKANFSPKQSDEQIDLDDIQDTDDIFLQFEDLIS